MAFPLPKTLQSASDRRTTLLLSMHPRGASPMYDRQNKRSRRTPSGSLDSDERVATGSPLSPCRRRIVRLCSGMLRNTSMPSAAGSFQALSMRMHGYATLLRGTENSMPLELWALYTVMYGRAYDAAAMRAAILLGAAERIRAGITGWIDHSPMVHLGEAALAAHAESGLRVGWAPFLHDISDYVLMELELPPEVDRLAGSPPPLNLNAYAQRFGEFAQAAKPDRVSVLLGPNAPQRCSASAWALWRDLRDRYGVAVHTHLMETHAQAAVRALAWWVGRRNGAPGPAG